jgi:hypothetical protein
MTKNWLTRLKNANIEMWQYIIDWWEPVNKENSILKKYIQNQIFIDSIKFIEGLIEFMEGLIERKIDF